MNDVSHSSSPPSSEFLLDVLARLAALRSVMLKFSTLGNSEGGRRSSGQTEVADRVFESNDSREISIPHENESTGRKRDCMDEEKCGVINAEKCEVVSEETHELVSQDMRESVRDGSETRPSSTTARGRKKRYDAVRATTVRESTDESESAERSNAGVYQNENEATQSTNVRLPIPKESIPDSINETKSHSADRIDIKYEEIETLDYQLKNESDGVSKQDPRQASSRVDMSLSKPMLSMKKVESKSILDKQSLRTKSREVKSTEVPTRNLEKNPESILVIASRMRSLEAEFKRHGMRLPVLPERGPDITDDREYLLTVVRFLENRIKEHVRRKELDQGPRNSKLKRTKLGS